MSGEGFRSRLPISVVIPTRGTRELTLRCLDSLVSAGAAREVIVADNSSEGTDDSGPSIQGRLFTTDGSPLGPRFQVNPTVLGNQAVPDVAAAPDGRFVVTWESDGSSGNDDSSLSIQARVFDAEVEQALRRSRTHDLSVN